MPSTPVQKELGRIAADYRRFLVLKGLTVCWLAASLAGLAVLALFWLSGLVLPHAFAILAGLTFLAAAIVLLRRSRTDVALREVARQVERDDPRLNSLLLAALEQEPDEAGQLNFLQVRVIREALEANRKSPWHQRFTERLFFTQGLHFAVLGCTALVFCALLFIAPGSAATQMARPSVRITPGDASIERGSAVAIVANLDRPAAGPVNLVYVSDTAGERKTPMARSLNDPLYGFTLPAVDENTKYFVEYDGIRSTEFKLKVFEYPDLKQADAELVYPAYTGLANNKIEDTRRISAVEGTTVEYAFHLNKPVRSARLIGTNQTALVLTNTAPGAVSYALSFPLEESMRYKLELVDEEGRTNKIPPDFVFVALRNEEPKLKLQTPRGDQRISALQEVRFEGEALDDFGLSAYGIAYSVPGRISESVQLSETNTRAHEKRTFAWTLPVESLAVEPGELIAYYLWADDLGPDGQIRRSQSDIYFAEIRPFEEIFRADQSGDRSSSNQQQGQQGQQNPAGRLMELQKEIVTATWNLQRRENPAKPTRQFKEDAEVVLDSQKTALQQAEEMKADLRDEKSKTIAETVVTSMKSAIENLDTAVDDNAPKELPKALEQEQAAYQALLKLQAREYQVSRNRQNSSRGQANNNQRSQRQLEQLEFNEEENRYERESQASPLQTPEQRESLQVLNRLKELARRQQDMSERLKELQTALNEAKSRQEREELERQLKRLQEEQQEIVQDMDELRQRMSQPENQSRMAEAREQLDQTRQEARDAARQLENQNVSQALNSSSRAQQDLQKLSDDFRRATSNQFAEEMRQMRQQARELQEQQQKVTQKMDEMRQPQTQRRLSEEGPKEEALQALAEQRSTLTNLLQNIRQVTEQSEVAEPLLSRQLYETLRRSSQQNPEQALEVATQNLERNFLRAAGEAQQKAGETIRELTEGIERAARNVLGDEAESLRFAQRELDDLASRVERELNQVGGRGETNQLGRGMADVQDPGNTNQLGSRYGAPRGGTNQIAGSGTPDSTNRLASARGRQGERGEQAGERGEGSQAGDQASESGAGEGQSGERQMASAESGAPGQQPGQSPSENQRSGRGQQPGQQGENGQPQQGQQPGQSGQQGQGMAGNEGQGQRQPGQQRGGGEGGGRQNFFDQWAASGGGGGGGDTRAGIIEGPLTGADYSRWSDRLRDVEEILQDPELRLDVARVREQARTMRGEFKRHAATPQWDLVETEIVRPLRILQNRVADELARHASREAVVPIDRDPVPQKYADAVSRYYERLGKE